MEIKPDYYDKFKCIANECKHNCCIGWEIDIDDATLEKYKKETGVIKEKLQQNIKFTPCAHFILTENERCPFLNNENLCELILYGGKDMLCQICSEHPRFYNDVYGTLEIGIGLSCEVAAKIILTNNDVFKLVPSGGQIPKNHFYEERNEILTILQNRSKPLNDRINELFEKLTIALPVAKVDWISVYKNLERLDKAWDSYLDKVDLISKSIPTNLQIPYEQLLCYFIYRHLSGGIDDFLFEERIQFAVLSCYIIASANKSETIEEMLDIARIYSSEIEYSDENINILLEKLCEYNNKYKKPHLK